MFWESEPPPRFAHMPLPKSSRAILSPSICFISRLRIDSKAFSSPLAQLSRFFLCFYRARQGVEGNSRLTAFGYGRCGRREESGGRAPLKLSLQVKWNSAHNQSSAFVDAPVSRLNAHHRSKVRKRARQRSCQSRATTIEGGTEHAATLNRRAAWKISTSSNRFR